MRSGANVVSDLHTLSESRPFSPSHPLLSLTLSVSLTHSCTSPFLQRDVRIVGEVEPPPVNDETANKMSLFFAYPNPFTKALIDVFTADDERTPGPREVCLCVLVWGVRV